MDSAFCAYYALRVEQSHSAFEKRAIAQICLSTHNTYMKICTKCGIEQDDGLLREFLDLLEYKIGVLMNDLNQVDLLATGASAPRAMLYYVGL